MKGRRGGGGNGAMRRKRAVFPEKGSRRDSGSKRIDVVDALHGFAVMAIMLLHFIYNSYPVAPSPLVEAVNQQFKEALFFLFAGKSYTIFSLLLGFTFVCGDVPSRAAGSGSYRV